jgi:uncharacterized protein (DUF2252 family)
VNRPAALKEATDRGRAVRDASPRSSLAALADRPASYDPVARLEWQGESRVRELLSLRYSRMLASPLAFYRGTALLMAEDLARGSSTALEVQICGDAHLSNFNLFSSPERRLVFDVDDFDETDIGPFEWDVKRLAASLVLASSSLGHSPSQQEKIALAAAREYRSSVRRFAAETRLGIWYASLDVNAIVNALGGFFTDNALRRVDRVVRTTERESNHKAYQKFVTYESGEPRIISSPPLLVPLAELSGHAYLSRDQIDQIIHGYGQTLSSDRQVLLGQFTIVDAARKVVGVGSVGTEGYAVLLTGRDEHDPFLLQLKQATTSVIATARAATSHRPDSERVVRGQRLMQASSDVFLGWYTLDDAKGPRSFYVRQLYDDKASIEISRLDEKMLVMYGRVCAWVLARAHARAGLGGEIAGYLGKSDVADEAFAAFAVAYAQRTMNDYQALRAARDEGRITVAT